MRKALLVVILAGASAFAGTVSGSLSFSNTPLLRPEGESEPAVAVANDGTVAVTGLQWLFNPSFFGTHFWTGPFGATPTFQGLLDSGLRQPGKIVFGSGDADFDIGSNNTLHATTLMFFINPTFRTAQLGVSAVIRPNVTSPASLLRTVPGISLIGPSQTGIGLLRMARMCISVTTIRGLVRSFTSSVPTMTVSLGTELATRSLAKMESRPAPLSITFKGRL